MLHYARNSQHSQNIQINKVIGESEKCVFYLTEKNIWAFWPTQYMLETGNLRTKDIFSPSWEIVLKTCSTRHAVSQDVVQLFAVSQNVPPVLISITSAGSVLFF